MRKTVQTLALLASGVGVVFAAAPRGEAPEARAYLSIGYGQAKQVPSQFFYGLRLDHDSRSELRGAAPIAQLSFDRDGFESARLNGLPFTRRLSANQDEGSGGSEGGMFSNYSALDWTLLAVGAVGVGFAISQVADSKDTPDPAAGSSSGGSSACLGVCSVATPIRAPMARTAAAPNTPTGSTAAAARWATSSRAEPFFA